MNKAFELWQWENEPSTETPLSAEFLNRINNGLNEVDNRVIIQSTTKLDVTTANTMVKDVFFDEASGIFTIIKLNGSTIKIDTKLEKLILNWRFDPETQTLYLVLDDGTEMPVDLSALITPIEFVDSDTIYATIHDDGTVSFGIKNGSIAPEKLNPNYLADIRVESAKAQASQQAAALSETNAKTSENAAKASEIAATASEANAKASETAAKTSETNAATSASTATSKATSASDSATKAKASETNAKTSETNSKNSEDNAKASETNAKNSANSAKDDADRAAMYSGIVTPQFYIDTDTMILYQKGGVKISFVVDENNMLYWKVA